MIAICIPTRGYVFSRVLEAVERERATVPGATKLLVSYGKKIPQSHNELAVEALSDPNVHHVWFVEEDTIPPEGSLKKLFYVTEGISFIDYSVDGWSCSARHDKTKEILWCGLGCTMIKRAVFESVGVPYFRSDKQFRLNDGVWIDVPEEQAYGGQDIWFCLNARDKGHTLKQIPGECEHLQMISFGDKGVNAGVHTITQRVPIKREQLIDFKKERYGNTISR